MSRRYATRVGGECDARRGVSRLAPPRAAPMPQLSSRVSGAQPRCCEIRRFDWSRRSISSCGSPVIDASSGVTDGRNRRLLRPRRSDDDVTRLAFPGPRPGRARAAATQERTSRVRTLPGNMAFVIGAPASLTVRAATHVNPKATKHHTKTRPKKVRAAHRAPQDRPPKTLNPETRGPGHGRARASPARARAASTSPPASANLRARTPTPRRLARRLTSPHPPPPAPALFLAAAHERPQPQEGGVPRDQGGGEAPRHDRHVGEVNAPEERRGFRTVRSRARAWFVRDAPELGAAPRSSGGANSRGRSAETRREDGSQSIDGWMIGVARHAPSPRSEVALLREYWFENRSHSLRGSDVVSRAHPRRGDGGATAAAAARAFERLARHGRSASSPERSIGARGRFRNETRFGTGDDCASSLLVASRPPPILPTLRRPALRVARAAWARVGPPGCVGRRSPRFASRSARRRARRARRRSPARARRPSPRVARSLAIATRVGRVRAGSSRPARRPARGGC